MYTGTVKLNSYIKYVNTSAIITLTNKRISDVFRIKPRHHRSRKGRMKGKSSNSGSVRSSNGKKTELRASFKEENRASARILKHQEKILWGPDGSQMANSQGCVTNATDLARLRKLGEVSRHVLFFCEAPSEDRIQYHTHMNEEVMAGPKNSREQEKDAAYDRQIEKLKFELRQLRRGS
ncbi:predicted protein [Sclerotinia sclerotiorum 1980 UF-70]|uniref:Uncharacterized protein n=1 Tax=Sclerotinia sclerotiorum (strain ATCC 18683 / 1980 / Ss-1) TaxID=665079 RepID=A7EGI7_SCLS1|nr:predicted protein [Sclerotinia sclerotiorum 1980 UF-70]EDO01953.1 predicted protein [Sclerotinia sclerotiorum 1980 UF-70]